MNDPHFKLAEGVPAVRARRAGRTALISALLVALAAVGFATSSQHSPVALQWVTGAVLIVLLASTWLLCAHAGGHALFVPLPALALAVLWAITVPGHHDGEAWWLVASSAAAAGVGAMVGATALRQQLRAAALPRPTLTGASGTTVTELNPAGVVQVASESWSALSLSGPLPAGVPVHVVRVDGVRLEVWSEAGIVPGQQVLDIEEEQR